MSMKEIVEAWGGRPTFAIVDLDALATNTEVLKEHVGPDVTLMAVVKANAYGVGAVPFAETVLAHGAGYLAVATVDEGAQLRKAGINAPLLVLGPIGSAERDRAVGMGMSIVLSDIPFTKGLARTVRMHQRKEPINVHLKIDTGMRRFGVPADRVVEAARAIQELPELRLEGLMTHFACADEMDTSSVHRQMEVFDACVEELRCEGIEVPIHHVCNSAGTVQFPQYHRGMVRPGLSLHGIPPAPHIPLPGEPGRMKLVTTVHSRAARIIPLAKGDRVSYGGTWEAPEAMQGALMPIGYADGYLRQLSNQGWVSLGGHRADIIGRVCMDQTMLRVPEGVDARNRERIVVMGNGTEETGPAPTVMDLAEVGGTIPHELMTTMAPRLPRLYVRHGRAVAIADLEGYRKL
jgi:alanine racemase